jgi:RNA polymerase sigma-70 factor (ECF subfamily)
LDERQLIARAVAGDEAAMRALYDAHVDRVFGLAYRLAGDRDLAEDFAQEAFLRAFDRLEGFRGEAAFSSWLHTITVSVAINGLRKLGRRRRHEVRCDSAAPPEWPAAGDVELKRWLTRAIDELPDELRALVLLHYVEGHKHREIAALMGIPEGTSKARLARARGLMRRSIGLAPASNGAPAGKPVASLGTKNVDVKP